MIKKITFDFKYSFYIHRTTDEIRQNIYKSFTSTNHAFIYTLLFRTIEFYLKNLNYNFKIHSLNIYRIDPVLIVEKKYTQIFNEKREILSSSTKYTASIVFEYENEELLQLFQANSVLQSTLYNYQVDILKNDFQKNEINEIFDKFKNVNENNLNDFFSVYIDNDNEEYRLHNLHGFKLISVKDINSEQERITPRPPQFPLPEKNYLFLFLIIALMFILLK